MLEIKSAAAILLQILVQASQLARSWAVRISMEGGIPDASQAWANMTPKLKTGDLILFNSEASITSAIIKTFTWAEFTHVALVAVMKYDKDSFTWSVTTTQTRDTVLCVMEVANHPTEDIVTGDKYHGFQISRLLDKVREGYNGVTFIPLKSALTDDEVSKLQSIVSCLHTVRARYEKGMTGIARLMLLPTGLNSGQDLTWMFCSDFVAYIAFEMGWLRPEDVGRWVSNSTKNFSPQDFVSYVEASNWNEHRAVPLDMGSVRQMQHVATEAESYTFFPSEAPEYWLKRTLQYEHEVLQCKPSLLTYLKERFPAAFLHFKSTFFDEIRAQQLWGGEVDWQNGNKVVTKKYVRLVALVNMDGSKEATIYYGDPGSDWYPNNALSRKRLVLESHNDVKMHAVPPGTTFNFTFKIAEEDKTAGWVSDRDDGTRSFEVTRKDKTYGLFVSTLFKHVRVWANSQYLRTYLTNNRRLIWVFPSAEVNELNRTAGIASPRYELKKARVQHVLFSSRPQPVFKI